MSATRFSNKRKFNINDDYFVLDKRYFIEGLCSSYHINKQKIMVLDMLISNIESKSYEDEEIMREINSLTFNNIVTFHDLFYARIYNGERTREINILPPAIKCKRSKLANYLVSLITVNKLSERVVDNLYINKNIDTNYLLSLKITCDIFYIIDNIEDYQKITSMLDAFDYDEDEKEEIYIKLCKKYRNDNTATEYIENYFS